jgi:hypothetical protein
MRAFSKKSTPPVVIALALLLLILVFMSVFCYDVGSSANSIKPGIGDGMCNIAAASGLLAVLTGLNLAGNIRKKRKWWEFFRRD